MRDLCATEISSGIDELNHRPARPRANRARGSAWARVACALKTYLQYARQRRQLKRLDARLLRDIGVTRYQAQAEWRKPFWRR